MDRFPTAIKAFYFQPDPERPEVALGVDVLAPEGYGEIIGGGQRIHDPDLLLKRIEEHKLPKEAFDWYIDLRKYGTVPHGGFGMGIERVRGVDLRAGARPRDHRLPAMLYRPDVPLNLCSMTAHMHIAIIGAPLDLGQGRRGVDMGPSALRVAESQHDAARRSATRSRTWATFPWTRPKACPTATATPSICRRSPRPASASAIMVERRAGQRHGAAGAGRRSFRRGRHRGRRVAVLPRRASRRSA